MSKWNDIPYRVDLDPEVKGIIFDLQIEENGGDSSVTHTFVAEDTAGDDCE